MVNFLRKCSLVHFATHGVFSSFEINGPRFESFDKFSVADVFEMYRAGGKLRPQLVVLNTCTTCQNSGNAGETREMFLLVRVLIASIVTTSGSYGNGNFADLLW